MKHLVTKLITVLIVSLVTAGLNAQDNAEEIMKKAHLAMYYGGDNGISDVKMTIVNSRGKERLREFTMLRLDLEEGGRQKYYTYFRMPHDVSRLTFMVHKLPDATDNRWLYVPAIDLVKRIAADDKGSSFVGSDFTYEDVSGRHWSEDNHKIIGEDKIGEAGVYVIESIPNEKFKGFSRKVSYIDKNTYLPLKEEYYNKKDELERVFTVEKVEVIDNIPTPTVRKMANVKKEQHTLVEFDAIRYNIGVEEDIFTERYLKNPPREFIN
jgi:outer membrane lipoprotein-sorting protein